ncbi:protein kinase [Actinoplanes sp. DH11]|uniref:protein kinase domain-containing protein n=1 Tax=Actinoplanes sp. DH11 TaxID=2857011 RepID=UPI0035B03E67
MAVRQMLVADRYRLLEPVGAGGMGRVWLARDEMLHRDIAIKEIVPPAWMTGAEQHRLRARTLREARSAARLNHPHVVRIYDVVHSGDQSWIVMEYIPSRSLHQVLADEGPYDPAGAARIGLAVLDALDAAHHAGVLHRDVKPHNVLIGADGRVVLTDFGLATFVDDGSVTMPGLIVGSPQYVSPERARDGASTVEADLWSLGATLYAAVEGRSPYARDSAMATLAALASDPPDPPVRAGPLAPILDGLLRFEPADRLTAAEVERGLLGIVATDHRDIPLVPGQRGPLRPLIEEAAPLRGSPVPGSAVPGFPGFPPSRHSPPEAESSGDIWYPVEAERPDDAPLSVGEWHSQDSGPVGGGPLSPLPPGGGPAPQPWPRPEMVPDVWPRPVPAPSTGPEPLPWPETEPSPWPGPEPAPRPGPERSPDRAPGAEAAAFSVRPAQGFAEPVTTPERYAAADSSPIPASRPQHHTDAEPVKKPWRDIPETGNDPYLTGVISMPDMSVHDEATATTSDVSAAVVPAIASLLSRPTVSRPPATDDRGQQASAEGVDQYAATEAARRSASDFRPAQDSPISPGVTEKDHAVLHGASDDPGSVVNTPTPPAVRPDAATNSLPPPPEGPLPPGNAPLPEDLPSPGSPPLPGNAPLPESPPLPEGPSLTEGAPPPGGLPSPEGPPPTAAARRPRPRPRPLPRAAGQATVRSVPAPSVALVGEILEPAATPTGVAPGTPRKRARLTIAAVLLVLMIGGYLFQQRGTDSRLVLPPSGTVLPAQSAEAPPANTTSTNAASGNTTSTNAASGNATSAHAMPTDIPPVTATSADVTSTDIPSSTGQTVVPSASHSAKVSPEQPQATTAPAEEPPTVTAPGERPPGNVPTKTLPTGATTAPFPSAPVQASSSRKAAAIETRASRQPVQSRTFAGPGGFSPITCDTPAPAGLRTTPKRGAARGVNGGTLPVGWSYFSDGSGFHLAVPDGWTFQRIGAIYCFRDPRGSHVMSLDLARNPADDPVKACRAEDRRLRREGKIPGYALVSIKRVALLHRAADWDVRYQGPGGLRRSSTRWMTVGDKAYAIGWAVPDAAWAENDSRLRMVRTTFFTTRPSRDAGAVSRR